MSDERIRQIEIDMTEQRIRLDSMEALVRRQNAALEKLTDQLSKLQGRLTIIGAASIGVIGVSSEHGGALIRAVIGG